MMGVHNRRAHSGLLLGLVHRFWKILGGIIFELEEEFNVEIPEGELPFVTVQECHCLCSGENEGRVSPARP
jgi:hypothetical protein